MFTVYLVLLGVRN